MILKDGTEIKEFWGDPSLTRCSRCGRLYNPWTINIAGHLLNHGYDEQDRLKQNFTC